MTDLRFVGDVPWWLGVLLALIVAALSWRYYSRESFDLPQRLKWLLPLLRSTAFFLGIMLLTGPVLHHRQTIGELGRVQIYLDVSQSMTLHDRQMPVLNKLQVAERLGWLAPDSVDLTLLAAAADLTAAREAIESQLLSGNDTPAKAVDVAAFADRLKVLSASLPPAVQARVDRELLKPLAELTGRDEISLDQMTPLFATCAQIEDSLREGTDAPLEQRGSDDSIRSAVAKFDETPRWRRAELGLTQTAESVLAELQSRHHVDVRVLSGESAFEAVPHEQHQDLFTSMTDLSSGIMSSQQGITTAATADESMAVATPQTAIVLLSDGQHNSGPSPIQMARVLGGQGRAFYCVSIGTTQTAIDLALVGVSAPDIVFAKDRVRGHVTIRDAVPAGRPFVIQIRGGDTVLWQQQLLTQNVNERNVEFEFTLDELIEQSAAQFATDVRHSVLPIKLEASIAPLDEEIETVNNQREFHLAAVLESQRVLILDGRSRWETRYLRNVFERDEQWRVDTVIAGPGTDTVSLPRGDRDNQFPADRETLFQYDLVIFGEIAPELFASHELQWLREFVEIRGGGMIFIDGQRGLLKQFSTETIGSLLPIEWTATPAVVTSSLQLTDRGAAESALRLAANEQNNRRFWTDLPPPQALLAVSALPGAEVLVEGIVDGQPQPALVTQRFGAGRILYLAFDESWRWRYKAADEWHQRIWNQWAKFVMPHPFSVSDEYVSLDTGAVSYAPNANVNIRMKLLDLNGKPARDAKVDAMVWREGQLMETVSLQADPAVPGMYFGRTSVLTAGDYEVSVRAAGYSDAVLKARTEFVVNAVETDELSQTSANETLLRQISSASGGVFLTEAEMGRLPELLSPLSNGRVIESETPIWQSYWWFTAMILLLAMEWVLRKRAGLL